MDATSEFVNDRGLTDTGRAGKDGVLAGSRDPEDPLENGIDFVSRRKTPGSRSGGQVGLGPLVKGGCSTLCTFGHGGEYVDVAYPGQARGAIPCQGYKSARNHSDLDLGCPTPD